MSERGRALIGWRNPEGPVSAPDLVQLADLLLSRRGEASGVALARSLVRAYGAAPMAERHAFLLLLAERYGPDAEGVARAVAALQAGEPAALEGLHAAAEPRRQELFRRINLAPGGTAALVGMREDLLGALPETPALRPVDEDFAHLFGSWFNRGFLTLRQIDWNTPASILEKIIRYEAVHQIQNWDDLRNRLQPTDRRCFAFFHPQLVDEPLIFVEVALTREIPGAVGPLLDLSRQPIPAEEATTAVFYSISNTQRGLAGVSFGNFLIKQVVEVLREALPGIRNFVTLSPVPGFARWLAAERKAGDQGLLAAPLREALTVLEQPLWHQDSEAAARAKAALIPAAALYFLKARDRRGRPVDPVARFHLGNGARLERLNPLGDLSENGLRQSQGLMVNYLYAPNEIERNHEGFAEAGTIAASDALRKALPG
ncbi:malonyl-CoA decarboxylase [Pararhodobacter aggregans]|uniref:MCD, Malonyl-CoA decarboxylase MCD n=1 Tax=Pararhodobacter aggregans TaxID=404875 RepID=A0A2T7UVH8_9RHOB|nr:MCD, Malonyl-CoA decarboxylase MCD [Pararhodobacter aggregans]